MLADKSIIGKSSDEPSGILHNYTDYSFLVLCII
uniref:GM09276p n=1 Tax=Drosophila melanogaster TaxID=7227 RepID=Q95S45_DROME|nr:GM09276p [Drosophila melanogaster]